MTGRFDESAAPRSRGTSRGLKERLPVAASGGLSSPAPAHPRRRDAMLEIASETVDEQVNVVAVYDAITALLVQQYRKRVEAASAR